MTGDDLKRMQDSFIEGSKQLLLKHGSLSHVGFVITLHKHVDKLFESGYGVEFIDPKSCLRDTQDDSVTTLIIDLSMDWKKLYHAVLTVFPKTQNILPELLALGAGINIDDPYMRVMRPFMSATQLDEKDIMAATMRQICDKVDAFASLFHSEAWQLSGSGDRDNLPDDLSTDPRSIEVIISTMETYEFARMVTVPIQRKPSKTKTKRDGGKIVGFGKPVECVDRADGERVLEGRMARFLKPLEVAS